MAGRSQAEKERRHELFVRAYAQTGEAASAVIAAGYSEKNATVTGAQLLADHSLAERARKARDAVVAQQADAYDRQHRRLVEEADAAIVALSEIASRAPKMDDGKVDKSYHTAAMARVAAAVAILDRAGHKPIERVEQSIRWQDVTRELADVDGADVLRNALREIGESEAAQPEHAE